MCGFSRRRIIKNKSKGINPTLFTTFIVLSHIEDEIVIKILQSIK